MISKIPHNKPTIKEDDLRAVLCSLHSGWLAQGSYVKKFERSVCDYLGGNERLSGIAVSNGTAALYLAFYGLGIKQNDEIILPTYTCSAILNAINLIGAKPILVDIDPITWNISYEMTVSALCKRTKAIILTHTFGVPAPIGKFLALGVPIIEDCAQAIGATIENQKVGTFGKVSIFSFYASKMITTGQGGMVVSADNRIVSRIRDYREFDCRKNYYPRFNFQMTDFQAALGISQLNRIDDFISLRRMRAERYRTILENSINISWQRWHEGTQPNYYRFVLKTHRNISWMEKIMKKMNIQCIRPIAPFELLHRYLHLDRKQFSFAEEISRSTLSVPIFPAMSKENVDRILCALKAGADRIKRGQCKK